MSLYLLSSDQSQKDRDDARKAMPSIAEVQNTGRCYSLRSPHEHHPNNPHANRGPRHKQEKISLRSVLRMDSACCNNRNTPFFVLLRWISMVFVVNSLLFHWSSLFYLHQLLYELKKYCKKHVIRMKICALLDTWTHTFSRSSFIWLDGLGTAA